MRLALLELRLALLGRLVRQEERLEADRMQELRQEVEHMLHKQAGERIAVAGRIHLDLADNHTESSLAEVLQELVAVVDTVHNWDIQVAGRSQLEVDVLGIR